MLPLPSGALTPKVRLTSVPLPSQTSPGTWYCDGTAATADLPRITLWNWSECWLCWNSEYWASRRTPSKFFFMMKLTTPATASAPYTAEAPPVRTSTRSTRGVGMKFRSAATAEVLVSDAVGLPACRRRPSISTTVRTAPRPRRLTVAVPCEPLA